QAGSAKTIAGGATAKDTPAVNLIEGRVIEELRVAMRAFDKARQKDPEIPRITPGPGTRRVLAGRPKKASGREPPADGSPGAAPPGAPAPAPPAPTKPVPAPAPARKKKTRRRK